MAGGEPESGHERLVRVAVPAGVEETFTYRLPAKLGDVLPGTRVLVPFGRQRLTGFVVGHEKASTLPLEKLRAVEDVLDVQPSLPPDVLELGRFVADYYACPLGEVLRTMHPGGPAGTTVARLTDAGRLAVAGGRVRGARQREVLEELARVDSATALGLRRRLKLPAVHALLRELASRGWVEVSERLAPAARKQVVVLHALALAPDDERVRQAVARAPSRRAVVEALAAAAGEALTAAALAERMGRPVESVRAALAALVAAGVVSTFERVLARTPSAPGGGEDAVAARRALAPAQEKALAEAVRLVEAAAFDVLLLEGVTGSGKTEVYLRALAHCVASGRTGLYLVPEIALTPLLLRTVRARFGERTAVLHSALSPGERHDERARILAGEVDVVLGARSAVFAPLPRLGLVVVDEEHESSYKQDSAPRYHGRDVAIVRARIARCPVVLGSATPSLESYRNAVEGKYRLVRLAERVGGSVPSVVEIVDMRNEWRAARGGLPLSRRLREALDVTLAEGKQALILLNRRGWADFLLCRECGQVERCEHCSVSLTVHLRAGLLQCHYCDLRKTIPAQCGQCGGTFLQQVGEGTEQLETALKKALPGVAISRLDRDVAQRKGAAERVLAEFEGGQTRVLIGTQMIAKAHDFPGVTLVGVLQADRALWLPDFRASERTFQLLTQVAGRAGRRLDRGLVIVQSYSPDHPALVLASKQDYPAFYESEAASRQALAYPPFTHLVALLISGEDRARVEKAALALGETARARAKGVGQVVGPAPAPVARIKDRWRFQLLAKSVRRRALSAAMRQAMADVTLPDGVTVEIDVDAQSLL